MRPHRRPSSCPSWHSKHHLQLWVLTTSIPKLSNRPDKLRALPSRWMRCEGNRLLFWIASAALGSFASFGGTATNHLGRRCRLMLSTLLAAAIGALPRVFTQASDVSAGWHAGLATYRISEHSRD